MTTPLFRQASLVLAFVILATGCASNPEEEIAREMQKTPAEWVEQARQSLEQNQPDQARRELSQALAQEPGNIDALQAMARLQSGEGDYDDAIKTWDALLAKHPDSAAANIAKAKVLVRLGRWPEAEGILQTQASRTPDDWQIWNTLGVIHDLQQDYTRAREYYSKALEKSATQAEIYNNLGYSQIMTHAYDEAITTLRQGLQYQPDSEHMQSNLAIAYAWKGDYAKAKDLFQLQMEEAEACNNVGYIAMLRNDDAAAEQFFQSAIDKSASFYRKAYENLQKLREKQGKPREETEAR